VFAAKNYILQWNNDIFFLVNLESSKVEADRLQEEVDNLVEHQLVFDHRVRVRYIGYETMIDGKLLNVLTNNPGSGRCPICHAKSAEMMDRTREFIPVPGSLVFGVSSLHFLLRVFEFYLNVGSNQTFKQWQCTAPFKDEQKANKAKMKLQARSRLGLILFDPRPGGAGNFHDGNSARRAFEKPEIFAEIVGVGVELIKKTYNIYLALASGLEIDSAKFKVIFGWKARKSFYFVQKYFFGN
jgi:hypothetical protein